VNIFTQGIGFFSSHTGRGKKEDDLKKILTILCIVFFLAAGSLWAQEAGNIKGKVVDTEGNALPGVNITLTGSKTALRNAITSAGGNFRFMGIPSGSDYVVKFELPGFKTINREAVTISFARDLTITIIMEQSTLEEEVTVIGETPVIDTKKTQVGVNISDEMIMSMPTARNPWVIMAMVPGMLISKEDVGGAEAGQQSSYSGHGSRGRDNTWSVDGANITDNSALGAAPGYLNIAGYEELQINYGNNDIKSQTGGVQLNMVSKRGGNAYSGTFFLDVEDTEWQSSNATDEMLDLYDTFDPGVNRIYLYGANFGGPLIQDKAWFYGSWGIQDIDARNIDGTSDKTWLVSGYGKINFQLTQSTRLEGFIEYDNKNKWGRLWHSAAQSGPAHKYNQKGPGYIWKGEIEQMFGNLYLNIKGVMMNGGFQLMPTLGERTSDGSGPYYIRDYYNNKHYGNIDDYGCDRDSYNYNLTGNYFAENVLGGDHEIKFGVDYLTAATTTHDYYEGNLCLAYYGPDASLPTGEWWEAWTLRDYFINVWMDKISFFIQDTVTFGRLSVNLGIRYDKERSMVKDEIVSASPWLSQYMTDLSLTEIDPGVAWKTFSPRFSLIYDLFGTGKDVIKLNVARYGTQEGFGMAYHVNPAGWTEIDVIWQDMNGDTRVTNDELYGYDWDTGTITPPTPEYWLWYGGFDPDNPTGVTMLDKVDPDHHSPLLDEVTLSYEKELFTDFAARFELFYKRTTAGVWNKRMMLDGTLETKDNYYLAGTAETVNMPYYGRNQYFPYELRSNFVDRYDRYQAFQIVLLKRLSSGWMMDASFTLASWLAYYEGEFTNPNNVDYYTGGVNSWMNSPWQFKVSGLYQAPLGINVSWIFRARQGYVWDQYVRVNRPGMGWGSIYGFDGSSGVRGDARLPNFMELDFRLEKVFQVSDTSKVVIAADAFNLFNSNTTLEQFSNFNDSRHGQAEKILNPRVFRFGIRFDF
jgi:hypothetical protein